MTTNQTVLLQPSNPLNIEDGLGTEVRSNCGNLWITQTGDERDVVLERGQSFVLDRNGLTVVSALGGPAVASIGTLATTQVASPAAETSHRLAVEHAA